MKTLSRKATMRVVTAGVVLIGLSAPALADHFDWSATSPEGTEPAPVTAEDAHVTCPEPDEGQDPATAQQECDAAVAGVVQELTSSEHPENHGKYVSFTARCLKGMEGSGQKMSTIAQASEEDQMELAVLLCSESRLAPESSEPEGEKGPDELEAQGKDDGLGDREEKAKPSAKGGSRGKKR